MINVTRLNGKSYLINALFIEAVESHPDTMITLTNGKKFVVAETENEIKNAIIQFYRSINLLGFQSTEGDVANEE
ncbi:flagellar FlbD family protein [Peribacillus acanthi]|uniref:flagellar FlbD family protein n=1 Tax=Peribacillus acanthi TaxID=2171554 RepID=UPI000D3EA110|nr:flagellar FlbD family protein [Peribacillus acanthi]